MNSYQTLNAAAHISGIPRRHAVSFGQAYHRGHYRPAESFGEVVRRDQLMRLLGFPSASTGALAHTSALTGEDEAPFAEAHARGNDHLLRAIGKWNAEDKARQLALASVGRYPAGQPSWQNIPRHDYGQHAGEGLYAVVGRELNDETVWYVQHPNGKRNSSYADSAGTATVWATYQEAHKTAYQVHRDAADADAIVRYRL